MAKVLLRKRNDQRIESGHPWVYRSEIERIEGSFAPGDILPVYYPGGKLAGKGFINPTSQITLRLLTRQDEPTDTAFFARRLRQAWEYRQRIIGPDTDSYRLVYGEADYLPALIVDKFGPYLVMQVLALGMDVRKEELVEALADLLQPEGIYERSDVGVRTLEGLEPTQGFRRGQFATQVEIRENGLRFRVDIGQGQKTGYFFDQRENRQALRPFVAGGRVLDCFCYVGSFSLHAAAYGAREVVGVDISEEAVRTAAANAALNNLAGNCRFVAANAFDFLREQETAKAVYDAVILDPPAFTKSRDSIQGAVRGYKEINLRAMKLLREGGYLITSSCSYHMDEALFKATVLDAAKDAHRQVRLLETRSQAKDHPVLLAARETQYLKFLILQVF